jgi:hypothetical protein
METPKGLRTVVGGICAFALLSGSYSSLKTSRPIGYIAGSLLWYLLLAFVAWWGLRPLIHTSPKVKKEVHGTWPKDEPRQ